MDDFFKNQSFLLAIIAFAVVVFVSFEIYKYWRELQDEEEIYNAYIEYQQEVAKEQKRILQEYKDKYGVDLNGRRN